MRCTCCDSDEAVLWRGEFYCDPCLLVVQALLKEDQEELDADVEAGEVWITHGGFDEQ